MRVQSSWWGSVLRRRDAIKLTVSLPLAQAQRSDHVSTQLHKGHLKAKGRSLRVKPFLWQLDLGLTSLWKCEKNRFLLFKLPEHEHESHSIVSDSLWLDELHSPWNSPGQNTGVGSLSLLQGIFPTQGSNPGLPHCRWILYQLSYHGSLVYDN